MAIGSCCDQPKSGRGEGRSLSAVSYGGLIKYSGPGRGKGVCRKQSQVDRDLEDYGGKEMQS